MNNTNPFIAQEISDILSEISKAHKRGLEVSFAIADVDYITSLEKKLKNICIVNNINFSSIHDEIANDFAMQSVLMMKTW